MQLARAEAEPDELLVEVLRRPRDEAVVDGRLERQDALGHAAGRGDDHDHDDLRLQRQDLDVADRRGLQRRRGDDREQVRDLRQRLGRRRASPRRPRGASARARSRGPAGARPAAGGRRSSGSRSRSARGPADVCGWASRPCSSSIASSWRTVDGPAAQLGVGRERPRRHGLHRRLVGEHDLAQDELLARRQHRRRLYERRRRAFRCAKTWRRTVRTAASPQG